MPKSVRRRKDEEQNVEKRIHLKKFTDERQCKKRKWNANNGLHYRKRKIECKTSKNKKNIRVRSNPSSANDYTADVSVALGNTLCNHCVHTGLMCWYTDCSHCLSPLPGIDLRKFFFRAISYDK